MKRTAAALVDALAAALAALLLSGSLGVWFAGCAARALRIGEAESIWTGPLPLMLGVLGNWLHVLPFSFLLVLAPEAFGGAGPGKLVLGTHVDSPQPLRRFLLKTSGWWLWLLGLLMASWPLLAAGIAAHALVLLGGLSLLARDRSYHSTSQ